MRRNGVQEDKMIRRASSICGIGDALNQRAFLITYCKQKNINPSDISIYTEKYWWMFEGLGFQRGLIRQAFRGLVAYRNFGFYDMPQIYQDDKLDRCIAKNAGIDYSFDICVPFSNVEPIDIRLPERFITFNTGFGDLSGKPGNRQYVCLKSWPREYWSKFVKNIKIPCIQIGAGLSCEIIPEASINLVNKLNIKQSASIMKKALFHVDMEGGLPILAQHLLKKSVVLFGPTAIENQGRSFNLNIRCADCEPCYEWGKKSQKRLFALKGELACGPHCMWDIKPEYVIDKIRKSRWLEKVSEIDKRFIIEK